MNRRKAELGFPLWNQVGLKGRKIRRRERERLLALGELDSCHCVIGW